MRNLFVIFTLLLASCSVSEQTESNSAEDLGVNSSKTGEYSRSVTEVDGFKKAFLTPIREGRNDFYMQKFNYRGSDRGGYYWLVLGYKSSTNNLSTMDYRVYKTMDAEEIYGEEIVAEGQIQAQFGNNSQDSLGNKISFFSSFPANTLIPSGQSLYLNAFDSKATFSSYDVSKYTFDMQTVDNDNYDPAPANVQTGFKKAFLTPIKEGANQFYIQKFNYDHRNDGYYWMVLGYKSSTNDLTTMDYRIYKTDDANEIYGETTIAEGKVKVLFKNNSQDMRGSKIEFAQPFPASTHLPVGGYNGLYFNGFDKKGVFSAEDEPAQNLVFAMQAVEGDSFVTPPVVPKPVPSTTLDFTVNDKISYAIALVNKAYIVLSPVYKAHPKSGRAPILTTIYPKGDIAYVGYSYSKKGVLERGNYYEWISKHGSKKISWKKVIDSPRDRAELVGVVITIMSPWYTGASYGIHKMLSNGLYKVDRPFNEDHKNWFKYTTPLDSSVKALDISGSYKFNSSKFNLKVVR